eukprot:545194_1
MSDSESSFKVLPQILTCNSKKQLQLLFKILSNIIDNPSQIEKYGNLRFKTISEKFKDFQSVLSLLFEVGFNQSQDGKRLKWTYSPDNFKLLKTLHDTLQRELEPEFIKSSSDLHTEFDKRMNDLHSKFKDIVSEQHQSNDINCNIDSCISIKRVIPILEFYLFCQSTVECLFIPSTHVKYLCDIIDKLFNYSVHSMLRDIQHIHHVHVLKLNHLFAINDNIHTKCNGDDCTIYKRHNRKRRQHRFSHQIRERFTVNMLDKCHSSLLHSNSKRKFSSLTINRFVTFSQDDSKKDDHSTKLPHYLFGQPLNYHDEKESNRNTEFMTFVRPIHHDLKTELLKNKYYQISMEDYKYYLCAAETFRNESNICKEIRAKPLGMALHISPNDIISIEHLLCILTYCNDSDLQQMFCKNCRKQNMSDSDDMLIENNKHIANWCRLLHEAVLLFGEPLEEAKTVYRGISQTFIFSEIKASFWTPTSTTTNVQIAEDFIDDQNNGMILSLFNERGRGGMHFDCEWISEYSNEKERLFFGVALIINNVKLTNNSIGDCSIHIQGIQLFQAIITGRPFCNKSIFKESVQNSLINMIECYLKVADANYNIPNYIRSCFAASVQSNLINKHVILILKSHWCALKSNLLQYFINFERNKLGYFLQKIVKKIKKKKQFLSMFVLQEIKW